VATGTVVSDVPTSVRTYVITYADNAISKESAPGEEVKVRAQTGNYDYGIYTVTVAYGASSSTVTYQTAHGLSVGDVVVLSGATPSAWNIQYTVASVPSTRTITVSTPAGVSTSPTGTIVANRRYQPKVKLSELPTDINEDTRIVKKRIYRLVSNSYKLVATLNISDTEYTDTFLDADLSGATTMPDSQRYRPPRPTGSPYAAVASDDQTLTRYSVEVVYAAGSSTIKFTKSHDYKVGESIKVDGASASQWNTTYTIATVPNNTSITVTTPSGVSASPTGAIIATRVTKNAIYAVSYVTADGYEGPLSKVTNIIAFAEGTTRVNFNHIETAPAGATKKRIYKLEPTVTSGALSYAESSFRRVAEVPATQQLYTDTATFSSISGNAAPGRQEEIDPPDDAFAAVGVIAPKSTADTRAYVYTYVTAYGEEGPPSEPSVAVTVDPLKPVTVQNLSAAPAGAYNITKKRIYRSLSGTNASLYLYVDEIPVATTSYSDTKLVADLGESISSTNWYPPPSDLAGLRMMANGIAVGFSASEKAVYFSELFQPHAFDPSNVLTLDHTPVAIGSFGQAVAVLTTSFPYLMVGIDPTAITSIKLKDEQACVSKRSVVETAAGVIYASPDGLCMIAQDGVRVITSGLFSQQQWQAYNPSSMHCHLHEGKIHCFYTKADNSTGMLVFDFTGQTAALIEGTQYTAAARRVADKDALYIVESGNIKRYDDGATARSYTWRSKVYEAPLPMNFGFGQALAKSYPLTFKVYADGVLRHTETVADEKPFRLPSGFKARDWYIEVSGTSIVTFIAIAENITELKQV